VTSEGGDASPIHQEDLAEVIRTRVCPAIEHMLQNVTKNMVFIIGHYKPSIPIDARSRPSGFQIQPGHIAD
jgi:hypothetical protein